MAKGLSAHAGRPAAGAENAALPGRTIVGTNFGYRLTVSSFFFETIFRSPRIGYIHLIDSITKLDYA